MESEHQHKALIVDTDDSIGKAIDRILRAENIESVFADSGESALAEIQKSKKPFSLIIADQHLTDMKGTRFFELAKQLTPDSTRFLMSGYSEVETIIHAVNNGLIQRYNVKPWDHDDLAKAIRTGIRLYEFFLDNKKLLKLAKKQNTELYDLSCELMETTTSHGKVIHELDDDIETIEKEIRNLASIPPFNPDTLPDEIEQHVKNASGIDPEKLRTLFHDAIRELYSQFNELAYRNGFEMPDISSEIQ